MPSSPDAASWLGKVEISVESGLASPGDTVSYSDTVGVDAFEMGGRTFALPEGLVYDVALTNTGEGILATGIVRGRALTECDRCLGPAEVDLAAELSCYYLREEPDPGEVEDEDDFGLIDPLTGTVDLADAIQGAVASDIPFVVLCSQDCKGLCPMCGANLNEGPCGCVAKPDPDFERPNPFAALAGFTFADGTVLADHAEELARADGELDEDPCDDDVSDEDFEAAWEQREALNREGGRS